MAHTLTALRTLAALLAMVFVIAAAGSVAASPASHHTPVAAVSDLAADGSYACPPVAESMAACAHANRGVAQDTSTCAPSSSAFLFADIDPSMVPDLNVAVSRPENDRVLAARLELGLERPPKPVL